MLWWLLSALFPHENPPAYALRRQNKIPNTVSYVVALIYGLMKQIFTLDLVHWHSYL